MDSRRRAERRPTRRRLPGREIDAGTKLPPVARVGLGLAVPGEQFQLRLRGRPAPLGCQRQRLERVGEPVAPATADGIQHGKHRRGFGPAELDGPREAARRRS